MKRISILLALSACVPSLCQGYCYHSSECLVHYSPYAFSYKSNGLVPGGVEYSPYAFGPNQSGLVYAGTRYTPYAFDYNHSGLILDYFWWQTPVCPVQVVIVPVQGSGAGGQGSVVGSQGAGGGCQASGVRSQASAADPQSQVPDPRSVIRQYLAGKGFESVSVNYLWSVENKTVSVAYILPDKGLAIRYTNPSLLESLTTPGQKATAERQRQTWEDFAKGFRADGGSVYSVSASTKDQIVAALDACKALKPQESTATEAVQLAKLDR